MLVDIILYFLQSAICMAFFYVLYILFLSKDTFFRLNRVFLLLALLSSIVIPLLDIPFKTSNSGMFGMFIVNSKEFLNTNMLEEVVVTAVDKNHFISYQYFALFYLLGVFLSALRFIRNLLQLFWWISKSSTIERGGVKVVILEDDYPPFSFLTTVFVCEKDYHKKEFSSILAHEKAHIKQLHTFDLLFIEILTVVFWMNPLIWVYKKSIQEIHEYLADRKAVSVVDSANDYKKHLVNQFAGGELFRIGSSFGQLSLKKRIVMMGKMKTRKVALIKFLLLFPIVALLLAAFAFTVKEEKKLVSHNSYNVIFPNLFGGIDRYYTNNGLQFVNDNPISGIHKLEYKLGGDSKIYDTADVMPYFTGGETALYEAMNKNFKYPERAVIEKIEGYVLIGFVVNKTGGVEQVKVLQSCHLILDQEAVNAVANLIDWQPAVDKGNVVAAKCRLPIYFSLTNRTMNPVFVNAQNRSGVKRAGEVANSMLLLH